MLAVARREAECGQTIFQIDGWRGQVDGFAGGCSSCGQLVRERLHISYLGNCLNRSVGDFRGRKIRLQLRGLAAGSEIGEFPVDRLTFLMTAVVGPADRTVQRYEFWYFDQPLPLQIVANGDKNKPVLCGIGINRNELAVFVAAAAYFHGITIEV